MKKKLAGIILASMFAIQMSGTAFANAWCQDSVGDWYLKEGAWVKDETGYWYRFEDGTWPKAQWQIIYDDKSENQSFKYYYFNDAGYLVTDTTTPDGETVNSNGEQIRLGRPRIAGYASNYNGYTVNFNNLRYKKTDLKSAGYNEAGISNIAVELLDKTRLQTINKYEFFSTGYMYSASRPGKLSRVDVVYKEVPLRADYEYDTRHEDSTGKLDITPDLITYQGDKPEEFISFIPETTDVGTVKQAFLAKGYSILKEYDSGISTTALQMGRGNYVVLLYVSSESGVSGVSIEHRARFDEGIWPE